MSSRREEERNEKIIRGLMKLPPNRRCINCNSVGPQYVCTNFWTFICITCSGIHREFTHRVKSVSMAKFTSEEVDALQKGGNQRARELYLKAWPQKIRLPDNSNTDKVRDFIKKVYVDKKFSGEESSDTPSRESESLTSHENETRRASSYHSYSQSPPYDFQYEERRYGKHAPALTRKPGSDRGLYEGKLASFLSPTCLSRHANDDSFENEGSYPRCSDYSVSPISQRDTGSPLSESSRDISGKVPQPHTVVHNSGANSRSIGGRASHPQRAASFGSSVSSKPDKSAERSLDKSSSFPSLPQSSGSTTFGGLDLFNTPFAPQNVNSATFTGTNTELPRSSLAQSVNLIQQSPVSSVPTFIDQQPSQIPQPSQLDLLSAQSEQQSAASANGKAFDVVMQNTGAWTTFDTPQDMVPMGTENFAPSQVPSSDVKIFEKFNPFLMDQSASYQYSHAFGHESRQNAVATIHNPHSWNAYSAGGQHIQDVLERNEQAALHVASSIDKSHGFGGYEGFNDGNVKMLDKSEPPSSSLSSNFSMAPSGFPKAGVYSFATNHKPINPFDLPCHSEMESSTMSQFWDMSSLQAAVPNAQAPATYVGGVNQSRFPPNSVPSYVPGGVPYDPTIGSLGFIAGQAATAQIPNIHAQGPVASVGGNPFA